MWRIWFAMVVGCGGHGSTPPDANLPFETEEFLPQICTSGPPDDPPDNPNPNCPVNILPLFLDSFGITGATIRFVAMALGSGMLFDVTFVAGLEGLHVEHVALLRTPAGAQAPEVHDLSGVINLESGSTGALDTATIVGSVSTDKMAFRFDTIGPFQP